MKGSVGMKTCGPFNMCSMKARSSSGGAIVFWTSLMGKRFRSGSEVIAGLSMLGCNVSCELLLQNERCDEWLINGLEGR